MADAGRAAQVGSERRLAVGSHRDEVEPAARADGAGCQRGWLMVHVALKHRESLSSTINSAGGAAWLALLEGLKRSCWILE
jgi:hypothetical protein